MCGGALAERHACDIPSKTHLHRRCATSAPYRTIAKPLRLTVTAKMKDLSKPFAHPFVPTGSRCRLRQQDQQAQGGVYSRALLDCPCPQRAHLVVAAAGADNHLRGEAQLLGHLWAQGPHRLQEFQSQHCSNVDVRYEVSQAAQVVLPVAYHAGIR